MLGGGGDANAALSLSALPQETTAGTTLEEGEEKEEEEEKQRDDGRCSLLSWQISCLH